MNPNAELGRQKELGSSRVRRPGIHIILKMAQKSSGKLKTRCHTIARANVTKDKGKLGSR